VTRAAPTLATALAAVLAAVLSACTAPQAPARIESAGAASLGLAAGAPAPAIPDRWWAQLGDPGLTRVVDDALVGSPTLDAALARVAQAQAIIRARDAADRPDVSLGAQAQALRLSGRYTIPPPFAGSFRSIGQGTANLQWTLDLFGRYRAAVRQARAEADAAALDVAAARLALAGAVAAAWLDLARAEAQGLAAERSLTTRQDAQRLTRVQVRQGLAAELDLRANDVLVAEARQAGVRAAARREAAVHALAALAGRGADYYPTIGHARLNYAAALPLPAALPADLLERRPDLAAARARVEGGAQGVTAARRAWLPDVNLLGSFGLQAVGLGNLFTADALTGGPGAGLNLPLIDGGRRRADLEAARALRDAALADFNARAVTAVRETADALTRVRAADADAARQREALGALREVDRLNGVRVASGLSSRLDLVDNDVRLLSAELDLADLSADALLARVQLVQALGGGFTPIPSAPEPRP